MLALDYLCNLPRTLTCKIILHHNKSSTTYILCIYIYSSSKLKNCTDRIHIPLISRKGACLYALNASHVNGNRVDENKMAIYFIPICSLITQISQSTKN